MMAIVDYLDHCKSVHHVLSPDMFTHALVISDYSVNTLARRFSHFHLAYVRRRETSIGNQCLPVQAFWSIIRKETLYRREIVALPFLYHLTLSVGSMFDIGLGNKIRRTAKSSMACAPKKAS
jgi:hypothetical protein